MTADQSTGQLVSYWDWHELRPVAGTVPASHRRNTGKYYETSRENTGNSALTTKLYTAGNYHFNTITITLGKVWYFVNVLLLRNLSFYKIQGKLKRRMMVIKIGIEKVGLQKGLSSWQRQNISLSSPSQLGGCRKSTLSLESLQLVWTFI